MPRDHRNAPVSLLRSSRNLYLLSIGWSERSRRWRRIDKAFSAAAPFRMYWIFGSMAIGYMTVTVSVMLYMVMTNRGGWMIPMLSGFAAVGVLHLLTCLLYPIRQNDGRPFEQCCLNEGICPVCEYRLQGLAQEADGCVQCPECGAHWKPCIVPPEA